MKRSVYPSFRIGAENALISLLPVEKYFLYEFLKMNYVLWQPHYTVFHHRRLISTPIRSAQFGDTAQFCRRLAQFEIVLAIAAHALAMVHEFMFLAQK